MPPARRRLPPLPPPAPAGPPPRTRRPPGAALPRPEVPAAVGRVPTGEPVPPVRADRLDRAPRERPGRLAGLRLGDHRGLTMLGAVGVLLLLGAVGGVYDGVTGAGLRNAFAVCFVAGCVLVAATVHREDLRAVVFLPPLAYLALGVLSATANPSTGAGSGLAREGLELANAVLLSAPALVAGTLVGAGVVGLRALAARRR